MKVLESRETPGLGDKIISDGKFVGQFGQLALDPKVVVVKGGAHAPNQLDAITGATISSRAVGAIVNKSAATWRPRLPDRAHAPPLPSDEPAPTGSAAPPASGGAP
jgi:electron transport complex protein RnfG